jgi:uncharacterized glyoxalase superfamily protein PhnB
MRNRSVPTDTILPHIVYRDVPDAIAWLAHAFGFVEHYRYGEPPVSVGAQVHLGEAWMMLETEKPGSTSPAQSGLRTQSLTIFVEDVEAHFNNAKSAGVAIVEDLHETIYGELQYAALDLEGHHWLFSQHARDLSPDAWGAKIAPR